MTRLADYRPSDGRLARFCREVRRALTAAEGGLSWADNIGPTVTYDAVGGETLKTVAVSDQPYSVWVIRAAAKTGTEIVTGASVKWAWENGALTIGSITGLTVAVPYSITLGIMTERANGTI